MVAEYCECTPKADEPPDGSVEWGNWRRKQAECEASWVRAGLCADLDVLAG